MKISITTNNKVYSVEDELGFDSVSVDEAVEMFRGLLVCAGFHPSNVDDQFNLEYTWFTEKEREDNLQGHRKYNYTDPDDPMYIAQEEDFISKKVKDFQDDLYRDCINEEPDSIYSVPDSMIEKENVEESNKEDPFSVPQEDKSSESYEKGYNEGYEAGWNEAIKYKSQNDDE